MVVPDIKLFRQIVFVCLRPFSVLSNSLMVTWLFDNERLKGFLKNQTLTQVFSESGLQHLNRNSLLTCYPQQPTRMRTPTGTGAD